MTVSGTAEFTVRPDSLLEAEAAIVAFVSWVRDNEPTTRMYSSMQDAGDPNHFVHVFAFEDEEARQRHAGSAAVKRFTDVLYPLCVERVRFDRFVFAEGRSFAR